MKQLSRLAALTLSLVLLASCAAAPEEQKTNKKEEDVTVYMPIPMCPSLPLCAL